MNQCPKVGLIYTVALFSENLCVEREVSKMESGRDLGWGLGNRTNLHTC